MHCKKSLKVNFLLSLLIALLLFPSLSYAQQEEEQKLTYRRNDSTFLENYNTLDKEKYFPLRGAGIWTELNPNVPRVDYVGVDFNNPDSGWACGLWGAVIRTTNAGQYWTAAETPTGEILLKVHSYNGQLVMVVGHNGTILRSSDGGESFSLLTGITTQELWGVKMLNDTLGWICGRNQTLLKTTDAGLTWQPVITGFNYHYWQFDFLTKDHFMIACSQGRVLKTTNGGQSFTQHQAGNTQDLYTIDIIDSLHIAAAGNFGKNVYSSDGGNTWTENQYTALSINWIQYINRDTGYITIGTISSFYKTTNRGQSWFNPGFNETGEWQFELLDENLGYGVGAGLTVTKTDDGYTSGTNLFLNKNWSNVFFVNETKGFLISSDLDVGIYKTEDSGISYQKIENAPSGYDLIFLDSLIGFVAGTHKTTDGGENWYPVNGGGTKVFFINDSVGWSIGGQNIYKTTNSGENWFVQFTHPSLGFTSIHFVDYLYGWATILSSRPYKTTDGGQNWIEQTNLDIWQSRDVFFIDYLNGILLESNKLFETADGGITWVQNQSLTGFSIAELSTYEDSTIFIIGYKTYRSLDGGENWFEFTELDGIRITGLSLLNAGSGYAAGELGLIMKYYDSTYVPVELISFQGESIDNSVILCWQTASEINNKGFVIEKSIDKINWENIGFVVGNGTSTESNYYSFIDNEFASEVQYYRLKQMDYDGSFEFSKIIEVNTDVSITSFQLIQNYPNPFNPVTTIKYDLPNTSYISLIVYDILGRKVKELVNTKQQAGRYEVQFDASNLASGVYIYQLVAEKYMSSKKMILLR